MRTLWNRLSAHRDDACRLFILIWTLLWTLPLALVGFAVCTLLGLPLFEVIRYTCLVAGYPGIIIGFFGSFIFVLRNR